MGLYRGKQKQQQNHPDPKMLTDLLSFPVSLPAIHKQ